MQEESTSKISDLSTFIEESSSSTVSPSQSDPIQINEKPQLEMEEEKKSVQDSPSCDKEEMLATPSGRMQELMMSSLPDEVEDLEFPSRVQVFTNYKQFGAMYASKNNWKKAEWAYSTGIKQVTDLEKPAKSKNQMKIVLETEVEFRIQRASALQALGRVSEAVNECKTVLSIDQENQEAGKLMRGLQGSIYDSRPSGK